MMKVDLMLIRRIHDSISRGATGCPDCFAKKLGVSLRSFHGIREFMIKDLEAPIVYSRAKQSYYYAEEWEFYVGNITKIKAELIKGVLETINKTIR